MSTKRAMKCRMKVLKHNLMWIEKNPDKVHAHALTAMIDYHNSEIAKIKREMKKSRPARRLRSNHIQLT